MNGLIGITGASGGMGQRVAARLAKQGIPLRLVVRDPTRAPQLPHAEVRVAPDYGDLPAMTEALRGIDTLRGERSVFTRVERIQFLLKEGKLAEADSPFGLPKVRTRVKVKRMRMAADAPAAEGEAAAAAAAPEAKAKKE